MNQPVKQITIVGGGTAGWLTALSLATFLKPQTNTHRSDCQIILIESPDIPTVGVGEATIQNIRYTFRALGLDEDEWMTRCNASFKVAIKFVNWYSGNDVFWHPFGNFPYVNNIYLSQFALLKKSQNPDFDLQSFHREVPLCLANRSPKTGSENPYEGKVGYAYHLDAGLLAEYLKEKAVAKGVIQILDNVQDVTLSENGAIYSVKTEKNGEITGDLFIDCSGFRGLLINQALQEPFISYADALFCDRAIAMQVPTDDARDGINSYTTATARQAGWTWNIPLFGRSGNGYVYSSAFLSPEAAETEFRETLGERAKDVSAKHIKIRVGRNRNLWVKNCVAIGLAGGFIEPLESSGIYLIEMGIHHLIQHFPDGNFSPILRNRYNRIMTKHYEDIRDFIVLHYCTTQREDTEFWRFNKNHPAIPSSVHEKLELFQVMLPNFDVFEKIFLFEDYSYFCLLAGMNVLPQAHLPLLDFLDLAEAETHIQYIQTEAKKLPNLLPDQYEYLLQLRQEKLKNLRQLFYNTYQKNNSSKTLTPTV
jgi:tryptophan halogenase